MLGNFEQSEIGPVVMDVVLHAGDFLYFPRGWIHQVRTTVPRSLGSVCLELTTRARRVASCRVGCRRSRQRTRIRCT
jgi:hypothetical protein